MIRLIKTTTKLQAVLDAAGTDVLINVFYYDVKARTKPDNSEYQGAWTYIASNGTTDVDICAAPASNVVRNIDTIHIYNGNAATRVVTIKIDEGGTDKTLLVKSLTTGQNLVYEAGTGWQVL